MGLILDTNVLVSAERRGQTVRELFAQLLAIHGGTKVVISVITLAELTHGLERAKTDARRQNRQIFLDDLTANIPIHSVTPEIALPIMKGWKLHRTALPSVR